MPVRPPLAIASCVDARARLLELIDGELDRRSAAELRRHLGGCAACRAEFVSACALARAVSRASHIERAPSSLRARVASCAATRGAGTEEASYSAR